MTPFQAFAHACTVQFRILIVSSIRFAHDTAHHEFSVVDIFGSSLDSAIGVIPCLNIFLIVE